MLKKFLIVCSIVLSVFVMPAMAKHGSSDFHGAKGSHGSKWNHGSKGSRDSGTSKGSRDSKGSKCSQESNNHDCDIYTSKADKAYKKYLKYKKRYISCKKSCKTDDRDDKGSHGSKRNHKSKDYHGKHGSKGSHGSKSKNCKKYKKKADKAYKKYLKYVEKKKQFCLNTLPPIANDQNITTGEDSNITIVLTGADSNAQALSYIVLTQPTQGTLSGTAPNLVYTPNVNYVGNDSFTFKVNNGTMDSNISMISIIITPVNDAPVAQEQNLTLAEDSNVSIILSGTDIDGDILTYSIVSQPTQGILSGTAPHLTYIPNVNYNGSDSFTFMVNDGNIDSQVATVSLVITPVNDAPVAVDDNVSTNENIPVDIDVLANDSDIDGSTDSNSTVIVSQALHGSVTINTGIIHYVPNTNYFGTDTFTYTVKDNQGLISNTATVTIVVISINDTPIAQEQNLTTLEDTNLSITLNGSDEDNDTLTYMITSQPTQGTLSGITPNITYTPNANYNGTDSFTFTVNDGTVDSAKATVSIVITPVNDTPVADDKSLVTPEDIPVNVVLSGGDIDGDSLTYSITVQAQHGTVSGTLPHLTYTPALGFYGRDSFQYIVNDGQVDSQEALVSIDVVRNNVAPIALDQTVTTDEDVAVDVALLGVDSDTQDILTYHIVSQPLHGTLSGMENNFTYTPDANYSGVDRFTFRVNDGLLDSNVATVSIDINTKADESCMDVPIVTGELNPIVKFSWDWKNATYSSYNQIMSAPMIAQLTDDNLDGIIDENDIPDIVFSTFRGGSYTSSGVLRAISGDDGHEILAILGVYPYPAPTLGDIDNDGLIEILIGSGRYGGLKVFENNGMLKWEISTNSLGSPTLADIDNDGHTEIIFGDSVYDALGNKLWSYDKSFLPLVVNINDDAKLELISNGKAYDAQGTLLWDSGYIGYDFGAIGNFDNDKYPEIVLRSGGKIIVLEHDGTLKWGPVSVPGGGGGAITVSDVDADQKPEIGIAGANYYVVFEDDGTIKWKSPTRDYSSQSTGSTVFDFENDGKVEILYSDEKNFRIYDGETGEILYELANPSGTLYEYPVVADVNNDGHAEIILISNNYAFSGVTGIRVLQDANNTWAPTRSIWNQHSYHISNINDDGTIPRYEEPSWLTHNTYRLNTFAVNTRCQKPPKAYANEYSTLESTAKSIALLAKDINDDTLTYRIVTAPLHGTLTGTVPYLTYLPNDGYVGDDSFSYVANDGRVDSNEANITIHILSSANALVAVDDDVMTGEDTNVTIDVLANDSNGTSYVSMAVVVQAAHGDALVQNGQILYVPKPNYHGEDSFYYTYRNANGFVSNSAKVTVLIGASNDAPIAEAKSLSIDEDTQIVLTLQASDADNDTLTYSIVSAPKHGTLNGVAPYVSYTPDTNYIGVDSFTFMANDGNLNSNEANISIEIKAVNDAPVAIAGQGQQQLLGSTVTLDASASYDVDGNIISYVWKEGNVTLSTTQTFNKSDFSLGKHTLLLTVTDNDGATGQSSVEINIVSQDTPDTTAPFITVLGENPYRLNINGVYSDAGATAYDDRDGNISVGVQYSFDASVKGTYYVTYTATDSAGNSATATRTVMVIDNSTPDDTPPVITLLGDNPQITYLGSTFIDAGVRVTDDHDGNIGYGLVHNVNTNQLGTYLVTYTATDSAGNSAEANRSVRVRDPNGNHAPLANAGNDVTVALGSEVTLDATQSTDADGVIVSSLWQEGNVTLSNSATFTKSDFTLGTHTITLTVTDDEGAIGNDTVIVRVTDPSDSTSPIALISSPVENATVMLRTDIIGTASDANIDYYTLSLSPVGKNTYTEFARGSSSVTDGVLATLETTTLRNGIYDIKLTAIDQNGATSEAYTKVIIEGKAKIGNFSFTVTDFNIQVGGIPVQINRTYSTLQRFEKLDFTYAWSIDYQNVKLEENIHPGTEWKTTPDVLVGYCFKDKKQHIVNISLPDGTTESFEFKFAVECAHYFTGSFYDGPILKPLNGTTATLKVLDASDTVMMNNAGEIIDSQTLQPYNPSLYQLTLANGMVYEIEEGVGIRLVKDIRGDTLTYTHNGIESSRGESLSFTRDVQDRITSITDLSGRTVTYHYNQNDDLDYVVDQLGQTTTYRYQAGHLLEEYFDPSGLRLTKNIYDASGRLIQTIDADGNIVEFTHNIDGNEEIVTDKLGRISVFVYDDEGNVLSQTNPLGETTTRTYDANGNELSITDAEGNTITNAFDVNNNLLNTTDALGNTETTTYNDKQSPTSIADKNGNTMDIVYNAYNNPTSMTTASGATTTYAYDNFGNKITSTNEYNQTTRYVYDSKHLPVLGAVSSKGNLLKETRPDGTVIDHTYDDNSNLLSTTTTLADGTSTTTSNTYDAFDRMVSSTDELGQTTSYAYDARGNKVSTTDSQGRVTAYTYNNHNKLTKTTYPDGSTESKTYDAMDNLLSQTNQEGETTSYAYDGADRLTKTTYPDGSTTTNTYDAAGRTTSTTDQNANTTTYTYDAVGNKLSQTDALGNTTTFTYDANGNMLTTTDALGQTTSYTYNSLNQRVKTTYADGTSVSEAKNISGLPSAKTDEAGHTTQYGYDTSRVMPLLNQVTLANGAITRYAYDSQGKKTAQTDALGHRTSFSYKATGELETETLPQGETKTFSYDAYGKQTQITDYANKAQKFIYDSYDRLVRIELADGSTTTYGYTPSGRIKTITDAQGTITNTYDSMGRLKTQSTSTGSVTATITYSYDAVGNITQIETPSQTISKTYDALNRLKTVTDAQGTVTYTYDAIGRQTQVTYANGMTTNYSYDARNRVTKIEHKKSDGTVLQSFAYTLDAVGNRTQIVEHTGRTVDYTYNTVHQLTKEVVSNDPSGNNTTTTFTYDAVGNLVTKTIDGTSESYSYNANDQLIQKGSITYTYDSNGNLISDGSNTYSYDDKNRLIQVVTPTDTVEYSYDANDNRIAKTTSNGTTTYLVDANTAYAQVITESKSDGTEIKYTYGNDLLSDGTHSFLTDALGSTRGLVDSSEQLTDSYAYTPYGELASHDGASENSFLFTGEQLDSETDEYYLRARYYSPSSGRFLTRDTYDGMAGNPITQNHYLYGNSNPLTYVDLSGHMSMMSVSFSSVVSGIVSGVARISMRVGSRILFNLRANKKYSIGLKRDWGDKRHYYIYAKNLKGVGGFRYEVANPIGIGGVIVKQYRKEKQKVTLIRLSRIQFKVWEGIVWAWQPKRPNFPVKKVRYFDYCKGTNDCYIWAYWAKRKALEVMFTVPSR